MNIDEIASSLNTFTSQELVNILENLKRTYSNRIPGFPTHSEIDDMLFDFTSANQLRSYILGMLEMIDNYNRVGATGMRSPTRRTRKVTRLSAYNKFVKKHMGDRSLAHLEPKDKMRAIAKMWSKSK
jgi:hypothetical protein